MPLKTEQQMAMLKQLLKTEGGREKLISSLVPVLQRRSVDGRAIDISYMLGELTDVAGKQYAIWAEQCVSKAARIAQVMIVGVSRITDATLGTLFVLHRTL